MMNWPIETLLKIHCGLVGIVLIIAVIFLRKHDLFKWTSTGFWVWASFLLYYFLNPLFSLLQDDTDLYRINLGIAGESSRGIWILLVTMIGIFTFFISYLRTYQPVVQWNLRLYRLTVPMAMVCLLFIGFGLYSLLSYRALLVQTNDVTIEEGRFVGEVTGYESAGYLFLIVPIMFAALSEIRFWKIIGYFSTIIYIILALPNGWARFALVSILLALSIADTMHRKTKWPHFGWLLIVVILTVSLQQRGHTEWHLTNVGSELSKLAETSFVNISNALSSQDASMLATWYLESYVKDTITGFDYGLKIINYLISSWIPYRIFPEKYFLVDWLEKSQPLIFPTIEGLLHGAKSTLFGSFYCEGGLPAVIFFAGIAGFLCRKLDGMVAEETPILIKATGIAWMSILWMVFGSSDTWGIMIIGIIGLPSLTLWLVAPKGKSIYDSQT